MNTPDIRSTRDFGRHVFRKQALLISLIVINLPITRNANRRRLLNNNDKPLSLNDGNITRIARPSNQFELSAIGEDNRNDVASNPIKREQVTHAVDSFISQGKPHKVKT